MIKSGGRGVESPPSPVWKRLGRSHQSHSSNAFALCPQVHRRDAWTVTMPDQEQRPQASYGARSTCGSLRVSSAARHPGNTPKLGHLLYFPFVPQGALLSSPGSDNVSACVRRNRAVSRFSRKHVRVPPSGLLLKCGRPFSLLSSMNCTRRKGNRCALRRGLFRSTFLSLC